MVERWPPVYDAEELHLFLEELVRGGVVRDLYSSHPRVDEPAICQGDIVEFETGLPLFGEDLQPVVTDPPFRFWQVIGNTCDFDRSISEVPWTQVVPIEEVQPLASLSPDILVPYTRYQFARRFYLPPWPGASELLRYSDFLSPVTADKTALPRHARVVARLNRKGWVLLHSCLVRFLCRDDGRFG